MEITLPLEIRKRDVPLIGYVSKTAFTRYTGKGFYANATTTKDITLSARVNGKIRVTQLPIGTELSIWYCKCSDKLYAHVLGVGATTYCIAEGTWESFEIGADTLEELFAVAVERYGNFQRPLSTVTAYEPCISGEKEED